MDYQTVAEAIATAAGTCTYPGPSGEVLHLAAHPFAVEHIDPPTFEVGEVEIGDDETFGDDTGGALEVATWTCRIYVSRAGAAEIAHPLLRRFLAARGDGSIKATLEADRTLGGAVLALLVPRRYGYGVYEVAGTDYIGARVDVRVWGRT